MDLFLESSLVTAYNSGAQIARILTEHWVSQNMYCPHCGHTHIKQFENNRPVADFYCPSCKNEYELKSKNGKLTRKISDGAYGTMLERITSNNNPDFFFMSYSKKELRVKDFILIPKHFFVPDIIEERKPLALTARRAGWIGCNILMDRIPAQGRIDVVLNGKVLDMRSVIEKTDKSRRLDLKDMNRRSWLMDILNCVNAVPSDTFTLEEIYQFENMLRIRHPHNNNIKPKIRQQLQFLRDRGFVGFLGKGKYVKKV